jgi:hypothetical protein
VLVAVDEAKSGERAGRKVVCWRESKPGRGRGNDVAGGGDLRKMTSAEQAKCRKKETLDSLRGHRHLGLRLGKLDTAVALAASRYECLSCSATSQWETHITSLLTSWRRIAGSGICCGHLGRELQRICQPKR